MSGKRKNARELEEKLAKEELISILPLEYILKNEAFCFVCPYHGKMCLVPGSIEIETLPKGINVYIKVRDKEFCYLYEGEASNYLFLVSQLLCRKESCENIINRLETRCISQGCGYLELIARESDNNLVILRMENRNGQPILKKETIFIKQGSRNIEFAHSNIEKYIIKKMKVIEENYS